MRVFVAGKGGAGKTTIAAALCAVLAERGIEVVAVDADGSPNLALSLGAGSPEDLPAVANSILPRPGDACDTAPLTAETIDERFIVETGLGVDLVQAGRIEQPSERCLCCGSHATAREVIAALKGGTRAVVADLETGANDLLWARPAAGDVVVAVTEASKRSLELTRNLIKVARDLGVTEIVVVANKLRPDEIDTMRRAFPGHTVIELAYDPALDGALPDGRRPVDARKVAEALAPPSG